MLKRALFNPLRFGEKNVFDNFLPFRVGGWLKWYSLRRMAFDLSKTHQSIHDIVSGETSVTKGDLKVTKLLLQHSGADQSMQVILADSCSVSVA